MVLNLAEMADKPTPYIIDPLMGMQELIMVMMNIANIQQEMRNEQQEIRNEIRDIRRIVEQNNDSDASDSEDDAEKHDPWLDHTIRPFKPSHITGKSKPDFIKVCNDDPEFFDTFYIPELGAQYPNVNMDSFKLLIGDIFEHIKEHNHGMYQNIISRLQRINPCGRYN